MYIPCDVRGCDHETLVPEDPDKLQGPELGSLCIYQDEDFPRWDGLVVEVIARSYVWSPERHVAMNAHGYRRYDWSVIQFDTPDPEHTWDRKTMVVDDDKLVPVDVGLRVALAPEPEGITHR
jgi:hypothetical protein